MKRVLHGGEDVTRRVAEIRLQPTRTARLRLYLLNEQGNKYAVDGQAATEDVEGTLVSVALEA